MSGYAMKSPTKMDQLIGGRNVTAIRIFDVECNALIDTGSQVTTISRQFLDSRLPGTELKSIDDIITLRAAGGSLVPYDGYVEVSVMPNPESTTRCYSVLALVVPGEQYSPDVPVILGTNLIELFAVDLGNSAQHVSVSSAWSFAFRGVRDLVRDDGLLGHVKCTQAEVLEP